MKRDTIAVIAAASVAGANRSILGGLIAGIGSSILLRRLGLPEEIPLPLETGAQALAEALRGYAREKEGG